MENSEKNKPRLLKVITQAVFIIDDGENLTEYIAQPVTVSAAEWPDYAKTSFLEALEEIVIKD